jgi:hypothetical protein
VWKDNRTLLWDLYALKPIADIPITASKLSDAGSLEHGNPAALFRVPRYRNKSICGTISLATFGKRGMALTCSLDRKVKHHSVLSLATKSGRPLKWMKPASAVSTSFGGMIELLCNL